MTANIQNKPTLSNANLEPSKPDVIKKGIRKLQSIFDKEFFTNIKNKVNGVEPGFLGQKPWTEKDDDKMLNPRNPNYKKYRNKAEKFIRKQLKETQQNPVKEIFASFGVTQESDLQPNDIQRFITLVFSKINLSKASPEMKAFEKTLDQASEELKHAVKRLHIVKLDYEDPRPGAETVMIPLERAHGPAFLGKIGKLIHQYGTAAPRREKNLGALMEALANDVYKALNLESQDLSIRKAQYSDGYVKLLLEGKFIEGKEGEKFDVLTKQIKHGVIPGNQLISPENGLKAPIKNLGRQKIKALLLGDRDKVGRNGDNIGYIVHQSLGKNEAVLQNIDPGKSLEAEPCISQKKIPTGPKDKSLQAAIKYVFEKLFFAFQFYFVGRTDAMTHHNIHTDFSFDKHLGSLSDRFKIGYDNFSIFDDTLLSEKMEGVREILANWGAIENLFKEYKDVFSKGDLNFAYEIEVAWQRLGARKLYIENLFQERLELTAQELDFLDNVEKLTSRTTDQAGSKCNSIALTHLHVLPKTRHEWHLKKTPTASSYTLSFQGKNSNEVEKVYQELEKFCKFQGVSLEQADGKRLVYTKLIHRIEDKVEICLTKAEFQKYCSYFSESDIAKYKGHHQRIHDCRTDKIIL